MFSGLKWNDWCFQLWFYTVRLYWARGNLGRWDEICYKSCAWCRTDRSTCWPVVQRTTTELRMPPPGFNYATEMKSRKGSAQKQDHCQIWNSTWDLWVTWKVEFSHILSMIINRWMNNCRTEQKHLKVLN